MRWAVGTRRAGAVHRPAVRATGWPGGRSRRSRRRTVRRGAARAPGRPDRRAGRRRRLRRPGALVGGRRRAPGRAGVRGDRRGDGRDPGVRPGGSRSDLLREAHMRTRAARGPAHATDNIAVVCGAWHVPALTAQGHRPPTTPRCSRAGRKAKVDGHLGAVDLRAAGVLARLRRRGRAPPAGTTTCSPAADERGRPAGWSPRPGCCATRACPRRPRTSSRRSGWPRRWPRCAGGRWPGWRADRGGRGGAVRRRRAAAAS